MNVLNVAALAAALAFVPACLAGVGGEALHAQVTVGSFSGFDAGGPVVFEDASLVARSNRGNALVGHLNITGQIAIVRVLANAGGGVGAEDFSANSSGVLEPVVLKQERLDDFQGTLGQWEPGAVLAITQLSRATTKTLATGILGTPVSDARLTGDGSISFAIPGRGDRFEAFHEGPAIPANVRQLVALEFAGGTLRLQEAHAEVRHRNGTFVFDGAYREDGLHDSGARGEPWLEVHIVDGRVDGRLIVVNPKAAEVMMFYERCHASNVGYFWADLTKGEVRVADRTEQLDGSQLRARGAFTLDSHAGAERQTLSHEADLVGFASEVVTSKHASRYPDALVQATTVSIGILAAASLFFRDAVSRVVGTGTVWLYTKIKKHELLDHERRDTLFRLVKQDPGATFLQLHKRFHEVFGNGSGLGFGSLAYHLSQLERFGLIVSKREGRFRRYFENGGAFGRDSYRIALLQTPPIPLLARLIVDRPGLIQLDIHRVVARQNPVTRQTVAYHLKRLAAKGLIEIRRAGRAKAYHPTEKLVQLLEYAVDKTESLAEAKRMVVGPEAIVEASV